MISMPATLPTQMNEKEWLIRWSGRLINKNYHTHYILNTVYVPIGSLT